MQIDPSLIRSCLSNNKKSQKQLYLQLLPYLRAIANRYLRNSSYTKDVLQDSFLKIFNKLKSFDSEKAAFKSWAARIVINECINYNNRLIGNPKEELNTEVHEVIVFPSIVNDLSNKELLTILKQMPAGYFEVFNLYVIDGYQHQEIANILRITSATSRKRLSRAKEWLKKKFPDLSESKTDGYSLPNLK